MRREDLIAFFGRDNVERLDDDQDLCDQLVEGLRNLHVQGQEASSESEASPVPESEASPAPKSKASPAPESEAASDSDRSEAAADSDNSEAAADNDSSEAAADSDNSETAADSDKSEAAADSDNSEADEPVTPQPPVRPDHRPKLTPAEKRSNEKLGKRTTISKGEFSMSCISIAAAIRVIQEREPKYQNLFQSMSVQMSQAKKRDKGFTKFGYFWTFHRPKHSSSTNVSEDRGHMVRVIWESGPPEVHTDHVSVIDACRYGFVPHFQQHPELIRQEERLLISFCGTHRGAYKADELERMRTEFICVDREIIARRLSNHLRDDLKVNGYDTVFFGYRVYQFQNN
jgi:hypothetical protein